MDTPHLILKEYVLVFRCKVVMWEKPQRVTFKRDYDGLLKENIVPNAIVFHIREWEGNVRYIEDNKMNKGISLVF